MITGPVIRWVTQDACLPEREASLSLPVLPLSLHVSFAFDDGVAVGTSLAPETRDAVRSLRSPNAATDFAYKQVHYAIKTSNLPSPAHLSFEFSMSRWSLRDDS